MSSGKRKITRSRLGCHRCKRLKVKCPEQKPACALCVKAGAECDYSLKLTWGGRPFKDTLKNPKAQLTIHSYEMTPNLPALEGRVHKKPRVQYNDNFVASPLRTREPTKRSVSGFAKEELQSPMPDYEYAVKCEPIDTEEFVAATPGPTILSPSLSVSDISSDALSFDLDNFLTCKENDHSSPKLFPFHTDRFGSADVISARNSRYLSEAGPFDHVPIPPSLLPVPEILAHVPFYRDLFHFWLNVAADNFVPAPYLYTDNPFKKLLPQMAMHYPGLLTTILAFAARAKACLMNHEGKHQTVIDQLLKRSCVELLGMLQDKSKSTSDGTLATSLLLSCYEVCHCNDLQNHRTHTLGAGQIIVERSKKPMMVFNTQTQTDDDSGSDKSSNSSTTMSRKKKRSESDVTYFLVRWFIYVDVVGALSSTTNRQNYLQSFRNSERYTPVESIPNLDFHESDGDRKIDYLLGFDEKLLPHLINISLLIDEVEKYRKAENGDPSCLPQEIVAAALELKFKFEKDFEAEEIKRETKIGKLIEHGQIDTALDTIRITHQKDLLRLVEQNNILRSTNRLYANMARLNLYRRVLLLPRLSLLVQDLIDEITEILRTCIEPGSPGDICTVFTLFCAGCDALDPEKRRFYLERLSYVAQRGNLGANRGIVIMQLCWETGEDWYTAANMLGVDLVLM